MRATYLVIIVMFRRSYCDNFDDLALEQLELEEQLIATANDLEYTKRVLICLTEDQRTLPMMNYILFSPCPEQCNTTTIEYHDPQTCSDEVNKNYNQSILAVVAPKPLEGVDISEIPIYFYDEPYLMDSSRDIFHNAVVPGDWQLLKYAFSRFIQEQDWSRVAIISDNSWYSAAFEEELVSHFQEKQLVYHNGRCVEVSPSQPCDFDDAVKFVKDHKAFIVVANVGYEHAPALLRAILAHGTTPQQGFVWLTRDGKLSRGLAKVIRVAFLLTLAPKLGTEFSFLFAEMNTTIDDDPSLTSILHGLSLVNDAVKSTQKERIDYYYRDIARHMDFNIMSNKVQMQAYIQKFSEQSSAVISVGTITNQDAQLHTKRPAFSSNMYDVECFLRSEVFEKPCDDIRLLIFMFVLVTTVLIIFLYTFFFKAYESIIYRENHGRGN